MSNKLSLIVNFMGVDKMSGALRNIVGLGRKGSSSIRSLTGESKKLSRELDKVRQGIKRGGDDVADLTAREQALQRQLANTTQQLQIRKREAAIAADRMAMLRKAEEWKSKGQANIMAGAAASLPLVAATKQAMTFEAAMADVRKVVTFKTPQQFAQMSDDVLKLSTQIPMAAEGIAAIVAAAGRANIPREELLGFATDAAKMGVAFDISGDEAGGMMAKWRTAFTMNQNGVTTLANQINALTNAYGGTALEVSGIVTRIGALGKVAGVSAPQVAAMAQLLNSVGVEEEVAATGIKNMMLALTKGEAATKSQTTALDSLGLKATDLAVRMQKDAGGAITDVLQRLAKLPKPKQAGVLTQIFGSESVGALAPMLTNLDKLKTNFALVGDKAQYAGSMQQEYLSAIATTQGATGLAWNALKALNITLGQEMLPTVMSASKEIVGVANTLRAWAKEHPQLAHGIMMTLTGLVGFRIALGAAQFALGGMLGPFARLIPYFRRVDGISKFGSHLRLIGKAATGAKNLTVGAFSAIRTGSGMLKVAGSNAFTVGKRFIFAGAQYAIMAARFVAGKAAALGGILLNVGRGALTMGWNFMRAGVMMMANPIVLIITAIVAAVAIAAYLIYTHWDKISAAFTSGVNWVKTSLQGLPEWLKSIGSMMMQGLLLAISPTALADKLLSVAKKGITAFKNYFGIKSPSRLFMAMGGHLTTGLERGIDRSQKAPVRAIGRMATGVAAAAGAMSLTPVQASVGVRGSLPSLSPIQPAAARAGRQPGPQAGDTYQIYVERGRDEDIDAYVQRIMDAIERKKAVRDRSSFEAR